MNLTFERFRKNAKDPNLSKYEKIGFPNSYRDEKEEYIFMNIMSNLENIHKTNQVVMDIGPGCSNLPLMFIELCRVNNNKILLVDSKEMLDLLPSEDFIIKIPAYYPDDCLWVFEEYREKINSILSYSVLHYIFDEGNIFSFLDKTLGLLAEEGECLLGDIPNASKRNRFFSSTKGIKFHKNFMNVNEEPKVECNKIRDSQIDDSIILSILLRCRLSGFDAYVLPQPRLLSLENRREDILIRRP